MEKRLLINFTFIGLILLITTGCSTNREYIRQMVQEEIKTEMKDINDLLNVTYGYSSFKHENRGGDIAIHKKINEIYSVLKSI